MAESDGSARRGSSVGAFLARFVLAHFLAYPVGFLAAFAAIPLALGVRGRALSSVGSTGPQSAFVQQLARRLALSPFEGAQLEIVLHFVLWVALAALLIVHLAVVPWALSAARHKRNVDRMRRMFIWTIATTTSVAVLGGAAGWIWLYSL